MIPRFKRKAKFQINGVKEKNIIKVSGSKVDELRKR